MNNPFAYEPSQSMLNAQQVLVAHIERLRSEHPRFRTEVDKGKMFGILIAKDVTLFAFSGQIADSYGWEGFVPPVFDYLDEHGYFKIHEREISNINKKVFELESSQDFKELRTEYNHLLDESKTDIEAYRNKMNAAKAERDQLRRSGFANDASLIRESQFMKAELHRRKLYWRSVLEEKKLVIDNLEADIRLLKLQRQHKSDALQRWLFQQFVFINHKGEQRSLQDISYPMSMPPSGAGECCEPKLLNYAFSHNHDPIEMGMFWWGESPRQEIRHHLQFYPACNGKCKPILEFMLPPSCIGRNDSEPDEDMLERDSLTIVFEDDSLIVVDKPAGMLSVPGKGNKASVYSLLRSLHPDCPELQMVHRLDMDTSGLLVIAKNNQVHKSLQRQFAEHTIEKKYVALLENNLEEQSSTGTISLPLRPDYEDRPRQLVDFDLGKPALTTYRFLESRCSNPRVELVPHTGRTHQLRVHCAHKNGLGNPIKGDRLYGKKNSRLFLHAAFLSFTHPVKSERLTFQSNPSF